MGGDDGKETKTAGTASAFRERFATVMTLDPPIMSRPTEMHGPRQWSAVKIIDCRPPARQISDAQHCHRLVGRRWEVEHSTVAR